ncbi:Cyclic nucleotide-binding domain [Trypanosoma melophagium]|uniref:Cyclic nucleotide-binding domain n=1 Tax=Trypanosoma melophagium TaxID=715481 RepID=UPI00351A6867|nr:Cyclic nucleotide-binding domain [Trypanosoma melophagium]
MNEISLDSAGRIQTVSISVGDVTTTTENSYDSNEQANIDDIIGVAEQLKSTPALTPVSTQKCAIIQKHSGTSVHHFLYTVPHLFTLTEDLIGGLNIMVREYSALDIIVEGGTILSHVFVLASGTVEVINARVGRTSIVGHRRVGSITAPNIFGIDDVILEKPTEFSYHASSSATLLLISKQQFCALFGRSPVFANSVSGQILHTLSAFSMFEDFCRSLFGLSTSSVSGSSNFGEEGYKLSMSTAVNIYKASGTVFHKLMHSSSVDTDALRYCVKRLPENITETFVVIVSRTTPVFISEGLASTGTNNLELARRYRPTWKIGERGQTVVIARDGFTDIIDFVTNLCMLTVESKKIRMRLQRLSSPFALDILRNSLVANEDAPTTIVKSLLAKLPFSESEIDALTQIWEGPRVMKMLYNILLQREEYVVYIDVNMSRKFAQDPYLNWSLSIIRHIRTELGLSDANGDSLPKDLTIDVLFSSNITIKTLLCSASEAFKDLLEGYKMKLEESNNASIHPNDRDIYILEHLLEQDETLREAYRERLNSSGFIMMEDSHASALVVDLINVSKLNFSIIDQSLRNNLSSCKKPKPNNFIINIDRTFGAQIETVLRSLILTFGDYIRSVNVSGSVAGLVGNRGDVVLPTKLLFSKQSFGEDSTDETRICNVDDIKEDDVLPFLENGTVSLHRGACVTIPGVILYSDSVMRFYKVVHGCTSIDMRSSYVARQLEETHRTGVLRKGVCRRFLFYMDTVPLKNDDEKESELVKRDILFSVCATSRSLLNLILST